MARKAKAVVEKKTPALLEALKFISLAQRDTGTPYQTHCILQSNTITSFDGTVAVGKELDEEFSLICPHTAKLQAALERCGDKFSIVADATALLIRNEKLNVHVPCLPWDVMQFARPDRPTLEINNRLLTALAAVAPLAADTGRAITSSVLMRSGSVVATDTNVMLEYWHGLNLPALALPKSAVAAILKAGKSLKQLGYSNDTATFWFDDNSWLRTQLCIEQWPDISPILERNANTKDIPADFFNGLRAIIAHADEGFIHFDDNSLRSHSVTKSNIGATYKLDGIVQGPIFNAKRLLALEPYAKKIDFIGTERVSIFYGDNLRGAIVQAAKAREPLPADLSRRDELIRDNSDDIPF